MRLRQNPDVCSCLNPGANARLAVQGGADGMVRVCDSMKEGVGIRGLGEFLQNEAYVLILVWPMEGGGDTEE